MGNGTIWERVVQFRTAWDGDIVGWDTLRPIDTLQDTTRRLETQKYTLRQLYHTFLFVFFEIEGLPF